MKRASGAQLAAALVVRESGGVWSKGMAGGEWVFAAGTLASSMPWKDGAAEAKQSRGGSQLGSYGGGEISNISMGRCRADGDAMGLSINLRGDLAGLNDAELAARLEQAWKAHEAAKDRVPQYNIWYSRRGPIRHPWAYRMLSIVGVSGPGPGLSSYLGFGPFLRMTWMEVHLTLCEIRDLNDEIEHRARRATGTNR
jgi:hypothetical protein